MANNSWFKMYRKITDWEWFKHPNTLQMFIYLISVANTEDRGFQNITVKRGELVTSQPSLAQTLGQSIKSVRVSLEHLQRTGEVAVKRYPKFSVISIVSYDKYQTNGSQKGSQGAVTGAVKRPTEGHHYKNKEEDTIVSSKKKKGAPAPVPADADCSPCDWEIEHKVPDRFIGRFPNFEMWEEWRLNH